MPFELEPLLQRSGLVPLGLADRTLLPIVQGGVGIGVWAYGLAGRVPGAGGASGPSRAEPQPKVPP